MKSITCIETGIDKLLRLVEEKHEITITEAANELKIPRKTVDHWADTLEEAELIKSHLSLNEKFLESVDHGKRKRNISRFKRVFKSLCNSSVTAEDNRLKEKEHEIATQLKEMQVKIKELRKYEVVRAKVETVLKQCTKKHKKLASTRKQVEEDRKFVQRSREVLAKRAILLDKRENKIVSKAKTLEARERALAQREAAVITKQKQLDNTVSRLIRVAETE